MASPPASQHAVPVWLRWASLLWLLIWFPTYWHYWGPANFLNFCDLAVILTCIGLWTGNALLLSSQAISSLVVCIGWAADAVWEFFLGHHLFGGTEYLFDTRFPLWVRLFSLYHLGLPVLLLWALRRLGYDRRGWALQSGIAACAFIAARFTAPEKNINFAFTDVLFHRGWGPAPVHLVLSILALSLIVYFPTHLLLKSVFSPPQNGFTGA